MTGVIALKELVDAMTGDGLFDFRFRSPYRRPVPLVGGRR